MLYCRVYQKLACVFVGKSVLGLTSWKKTRQLWSIRNWIVCMFFSAVRKCLAVSEIPRVALVNAAVRLFFLSLQKVTYALDNINKLYKCRHNNIPVTAMVHYSGFPRRFGRYF